MPASSIPVTELGIRIAQARADHAVSVTEAAGALGVRVETVLIWEAGLPPAPRAAERITAWLDDLAAGRRRARRPVSIYALCEDQRREAAGFTELHRELGRMHRSVLQANESNDEQLLAAHEGYLARVAAGDDEANCLAVIDERYADVERRLAEMTRRVGYMRLLARSALAARSARHNERAA
jgi:hypothetical protein